MQESQVATPQLSQTLQSRHVSMISVGGMIGAGLFVSSSAAIAATGPAIVLSFMLAGGIILLVMRMLAEMAVALPGVRSFTEFTRAGLGNGAGFVIGWLYWYFWVIVVPVEAIAGANLLHDWFPIAPPLLMGIALMMVMTGVNLMSARSYGEFEFWFASIKVAAIIVFICLAASFVFGFTSPTGSTWSNLTAHRGFLPFGPQAVLAGVITVFFSLTGAEITMIAAAESAEPTKAVAQMGNTVMWRIMIFYVLSIFLIVSAVPWTDVQSGKSPFALVLNHMHIPYVEDGMKIIILTAVLSCLNSAFYVCSRVIFLLASHRDAPAGLAKLNARGVPTRSVMLGTIAGLLGLIAQYFYPETVFSFLVDASGALLVFIYIAVALSQIRLRRARERLGTPEPSITMWFFPWLSYFTIAALLAVLAAMALTPSHVREFWSSIGTLLFAITMYQLVRNSRKPA